MIFISNLVLKVSDGDTIASTEIYGKDKKTYINIGSGNVFKLTWKTDQDGAEVFANDTVDHYNLVIKRFDPTLSVYYDIFDKNVELDDEFDVNSEILPSVPLQYRLSIYVVAYGKEGSVLTSNVVNAYVCKGSGAYVKVTDNGQPSIKRALAFAKVTSTGIIDDTVTIKSTLTDFNKDILLDSDGKELLVDVTKLLNSTNGWEIILESYTKGSDDKWHDTDIKNNIN